MAMRKNVEHTGIYRHETTTFADETKAEFDTWCAMVADGFGVTIEQVLAAVEEAALMVLKKYGKEIRRGDRSRWVLPKTFPATFKPHERKLAEDAESAFVEVGGVRQALLGDAPDVGRIAIAAYMLGVRAERMGVRVFEPHAKRAIDNEQKRKGGHERKYRTAEKRRAVQNAAKQIRAENPRIKKLALIQRIRRTAEKGGWTVSERSIWNYLKADSK